MGHELSFDPSGSSIFRGDATRCAAQTPQLALSAGNWRDLDLPGCIGAWDGLAQTTAEPNPFFESWYLLPALEALDPAGTVTVLLLRADGRLVGLMPLRHEQRYYGYRIPHLRTWTHSNCFLGAPLVARGYERPFWSHLLGWADRHARLAAFLHLTHLPATGVLHDALATVIAEEGKARPAATVFREERAMLESAATPPDLYFEQALSAKKRKELRRQHRRLAELGVLEVERLENADDLAQWTHDFLMLEQGGWKGAAGSAISCNTATQSLFTCSLEGAARRGRLERISLTLDGRRIAMLATFLAPPGAFSFKTAFDEDFARFSPGVLLQRENLALLQRASIDWTDSCAAQDHPMIDHFWKERRTVARHSIGIGGPLRRALFTALARRETGQAASGIA